LGGNGNKSILVLLFLIPTPFLGVGVSKPYCLFLEGKDFLVP
jgi:hypothetical protein